MDPNTLLAVMDAWGRPTKSGLPVVDRRIDLPRALHPSLALVVQGVRRCGKSTLLRQMIRHYDLPEERCGLINFEDPRLARHLRWEVLDSVVDAMRSRFPSGPLHLFLDEIQLVEGWQRWLRSQLDLPGEITFVVAGSNASLIGGELGSALTGRHLMIELFPFDLEEFQDLLPGATFEDWLTVGGFPEPARIHDGPALLRQYFHDIVERDVRERVGARSSRPLRQVVQMVFETAGSELSLRRIAGACGVAVDTVGAWLNACEDAYLLFSVPHFSYSARKRAYRNKKYYPIDTALREIVVTPGAADRGKAMEIATFIELRRRVTDISYWRGKGEVDFVVMREGRPHPVQVSLGPPKPRHEDALTEFYETFPHAAEARFVSPETFHELAV